MVSSKALFQISLFKRITAFALGTMLLLVAGCASRGAVPAPPSQPLAWSATAARNSVYKTQGLARDNKFGAKTETIYAWSQIDEKPILAAFSTSGKLLAKTKASFDEALLEIDPLGNVWLGNVRNVLMVCGGDLSVRPKVFNDSSAVAFDIAGKVYLGDFGRFGHGSIRVLSPGGAKLLTVYPFNATPLAVDSQGVLYAEDGTGVVELDTTHGGVFLRKIELSPQVETLAIDDQGAMYVVTFHQHPYGADRLVKVPAGGTTSVWSVKVWRRVAPMAVARGYVYLGVGNSLMIYKADSGNFVEQVRAAPSVYDIEIGGDGRIYVLTLGKQKYGSSSSSIHVFDRTWRRLPTIRNPALRAAVSFAIYP